MMPRSIQLGNFKCIPDKQFDLNRINIFTGYNGRGKSSLLQAIMILSQSIKKDKLNSLEKIHLNGDFVSLGDFDEVLPWDHLDYGVKKSFLIEECKRAYGAQTTPNCREKCSSCGAACFKGGLCVEKRC